ncbi:MAG TPA: HAMP domain-containing sensor histidine kinase [Stellaceae bacterium]|nr:HAMP domain-containing sensor histidine kinase [Stellaceae bacterium]
MAGANRIFTIIALPIRSLARLKRRVMKEGRRRKGESLLETYCSQLGTLLDRPVSGLAFVNAKENAEAAADVANQQMLQAQASDRAKTKFLANMSHELRTPLNAIIGFSEVIKLNAQQPKERYPEYAQYIHDAAIHLLELINGILDLARIEAGKVELEEEAVPVSDLIYSAVTTLKPIAEKKLVSIDCRHRRTDAVIRVDQTKFKQVLLNLLSNAVKFTQPSGRVIVDCKRDEHGGLVISVKDTGVGIPREQLEKVLEPFEQVEDHLTRRNEGTGLGLPIAKALIELHGGELTLHSELNVGTTAELRLPRERIDVPKRAMIA